MKASLLKTFKSSKTKFWGATLLIFLLAAACASLNSQNRYFIPKHEAQFDFLGEVPSFILKSDSTSYLGNKYLDFVSYNLGFAINDWKRDSTNMLRVHTALKRIGYQNFISKEEFHNVVGNKTWASLHCSARLDSFLHYLDTPSTDTSNYYYKFWQRRKTDGNYQTLSCILREIKDIYQDAPPQCTNISLEDDTLYQLMAFDYALGREQDSMQIKKQGLAYFNYLKSLGLESSAFNLIEHVPLLTQVQLNRDSLISTIPHDTVPSDDWSWAYDFQGQGDWIYVKLYWGP